MGGTPIQPQTQDAEGGMQLRRSGLWLKTR